MANSGDPRGGRVWARTVAYIKNRDPQCKLAYPGICTGKSETADHKVPVSEGGSNRPDNLHGACQACNKHRGDGPLPEHLQGSQNQAQERPELLTRTGVRIIMDGAEKPSHRLLLQGMGVKSFGVSFWRLMQRGLPKTKPYLLTEKFAEDEEVYVDSGWIQAQKQLSEGGLEAYAAEYDTFLRNNLDRISGATEMHLQALGTPWINEWRSQWDEIGGVIWPIWSPEEGQPTLFTLSELNDNVALPNSAIDDPVIPPRIGALTRQFQTAFHALNVANLDKIRSMPLETTSTISWASPQMRGETIVWDGTRLVRYQASRKEQARARYKATVEKAGLDYTKILEDDATEVTRLAVWSYMQLERSMSNTPAHRPERESDVISVTDRANSLSQEIEETEGGTVAMTSDEVRNQNLPIVASSDPTQKRFLPVMGVETRQVVEVVDGQQVLSDRPMLSSNTSSLRQCNTCVVSGNCPAFEPGSACKFELPVEVKTKDQLKALLNAIIEIQGQRVAFARFAEEVNGGYPDPNLSQEIDRLFKLVKSVKDLEANNDFVRLTVERQQSGGVLSQLFGEKAQAVTQLPEPVSSDDVIHQVLEG